MDDATLSLEEAVEDADFIFLCVPVGLLESYFEKLSKLPLKKGCIITDVGSTKASIAACAEHVRLLDAYFIGGHPMAGSERAGVDAASAVLFENAYYVLTPSEHVPEEATSGCLSCLRIRVHRLCVWSLCCMMTSWGRLVICRMLLLLRW